MKSYPKTEGQKTPPGSAQLRYRSEEVKNAQKALQNMILEYEKVQARVETVKGASYISDLHEKLDMLNQRIKEMERGNRTLTIEQKKREVEMEKLLAQGAPDSLFKINELQAKLTIMKDQLRKEKAEEQKVYELTTQLQSQEAELKQKEEKLEEQGR